MIVKMYVFFSNKLENFLIEQKIISIEQKEIYAYGLVCLIARIGTILYLLLLSICLRAVWQAVVFYFVFLAMRKFAGGYHATTYVKCNALYLLTFMVSVLGDRYVVSNFNSLYLSVFILLFVFMTVLIFSPIENPNNPIEDGQEKKFRRYSLLIASALSVGEMVLFFLDLPIHRMLLISMFLAVVYMYVEVINRKRKEGNVREKDNP